MLNVGGVKVFFLFGKRCVINKNPLFFLFVNVDLFLFGRFFVWTNYPIIQNPIYDLKVPIPSLKIGL